MKEDDFDQRVVDEDGEGTMFELAQAYLMRPLRSAWRDDVADAPNGRPVYARVNTSVRMIIAQRDDDDWLLITREGEVHPLEGVIEWAPLTSAIG